MKLLIAEGKIAATAPDNYPGPMQNIPAPADFDASRISEYIIAHGAATIPEKTVEQYVAEKEDELRLEAAVLYKQPVTDTNGNTWRGGMESATSIKNGIEMVEFSGGTEITLRDVDREPHLMLLNDAKVVAATIGAAWQVIFQAEEEALRQLNRIDLSSDTAIDDILAIDINSYL